MFDVFFFHVNVEGEERATSLSQPLPRAHTHTHTQKQYKYVASGAATTHKALHIAEAWGKSTLTKARQKIAVRTTGVTGSGGVSESEKVEGKKASVPLTGEEEIPINLS